LITPRIAHWHPKSFFKNRMSKLPRKPFDLCKCFNFKVIRKVFLKEKERGMSK
jgi:hypothetical protein